MKTCNACAETAVLLQLRKAKFVLQHAVKLSHGSNTEQVVRVIAAACLCSGLHSLAKGYIMLPVTFDTVYLQLRKDCPILAELYEDERYDTVCDMR